MLIAKCALAGDPGRLMPTGTIVFDARNRSKAQDKYGAVVYSYQSMDAQTVASDKTKAP